MRSEHPGWIESDSPTFIIMDDAITLDLPNSTGAWMFVPLTKPKVSSKMQYKRNIYNSIICDSHALCLAHSYVCALFCYYDEHTLYDILNSLELLLAFKYF